LKSTPRRRVENSEDVIPVVIPNWNGEDDTVENMNSKDVLAVVVSYNGLQKTRQTVDALRTQVGHVHIVDNGSDAESLGVLESLEREPGVTVERLGGQRGDWHRNWWPQLHLWGGRPIEFFRQVSIIGRH
jgi:hypothetical protein